MEFGQCVTMAGAELEVLFGRDEIMLAGLAAGARGFIGSTYNYAAPVYRRVMEAFSRGDLAEAREQQAQAVKLIEVLRKYGEIPVAKAIMTMMGVDCGPARTPLGKLSSEQVEAIRRELRGLDVFTRPLRG
jgi:N-acetylneuraminate lyase